MHQRIRFPAILFCLLSFLLVGFSSDVNELMIASRRLFRAVPNTGTVTVTGRVLYPNRNGDMREVWSMRVSLYDYNTAYVFPQPVFLASTYTDDAGAYAFPPISNHDPSGDPGDPDSRLDLYIVIDAYARESGTSYSAVVNESGTLYSWNAPCTGCTWTGPRWNVPDGNLTLDYSIDPNDLNRPAMWLLRDAQRSWNYVNDYGYSDPGSTVLVWEDNQDCYSGVCNSFFYGGVGGPFIFVQNLVRNSRDTIIHYNGPMNSDTLSEQNRVECEPCENTILTRSKPKWCSNC